MTGADDAANPFWNFSLRVYDAPGVADACLALQGRHALDVNLLLFCIWAGRHGRRLNTAEAAALEAATADWQLHAVQPLRAVRRWLKAQTVTALAGDLREGVKAHELEAERLEQAILVATLPVETSGSGTPADAVLNLTAYFAHLGREPGVADAADLAQLLTGAFGPQLRPLDAVWQLQHGVPA